MRQNYSPTVLLHSPPCSVLFWSCQAWSTSQLTLPLRVVMPQVASSSWLPSFYLVQCIIHQLVQLHEKLHQGPDMCVWGGELKHYCHRKAMATISALSTLSFRSFIFVLEDYCSTASLVFTTNYNYCSCGKSLPRFRSSVCIQYNTWRWKSAKNGEGLVSSITWVMSGGRDVDVIMT